MSQRLPQRRPRFRFGLRALFMALTLVAIASWAYWQGWPRWQWARQQGEFEAAARQLRIDGTMHDGLTWSNTLSAPLLERATTGNRHNHSRRHTQFLHMAWPNAVYVVFWEYDGPWRPYDAEPPVYGRGSVTVYRLAAAPANYRSQTAAGRKAAQSTAGRLPRQTIAEHAYWRDFVDFLNSDRSDDFGFRYEVIHADSGAGTARVNDVGD
jgi:hypothetical protein